MKPKEMICETAIGMDARMVLTSFPIEYAAELLGVTVDRAERLRYRVHAGLPITKEEEDHETD